jgi:Anti-sigma-K factor rskA/Putative zinc-finger
MRNRDRDRESEEPSGREPHDEFLELCALSTSGDLTEREQNTLQAHVAQCPECRQALTEFEAAVNIGVPLLSSKLATAPTGEFEFGDPARAPSARSGVPVSAEVRTDETTEAARGARVFAFAHRNGHRPTPVNWTYVWLPFAACVVLSAALATYTYRAGKSRPAEIVSTNFSASPGASSEALEQQISDVDRERQSLSAQLAARDKLIADLRHQIEEQSSSLVQMKTAEANLERSAATDEAENQRVAEERASLNQKLDTAQASLQKMQAELESARQQRSEGDTKDASLQAQIMDLNGQLRDREQTINKQDDLLSHDRDIRDLMGARDLYIAEVYDVGRDGATQKPCGRVFYTKGKSLLFYAYDLDQQPGVRNARTFQAWGRRGADMQEAVNLGIFFQDSAAKKRWVVKFDDAKSLEQIDAVFVTVEPAGGSRKPSGKPLLFAYLKVDPNHP